MDTDCVSLLLLLIYQLPLVRPCHLLETFGVEVGVKGCPLDWFKFFLASRTRMVAVVICVGLASWGSTRPSLNAHAIRSLYKAVRGMICGFRLGCHQSAEDAQLYISLSESSGNACRGPEPVPYCCG